MDKVANAIKKNELKKLLLGEDSYAFVYPHYNGYLNTDPAYALNSINEYCEHYLNESNEIYEFNSYLNKNLHDLCTSAYNTLYLLNYINVYLLNVTDYQKKYLFDFDVRYLVESVNQLYPSYVEQIINDKFLGLDYVCLYKKLIYDYEGISGNIYKGINTYLSEMSVFPLVEIKELTSIL